MHLNKCTMTTKKYFLYYENVKITYVVRTTLIFPMHLKQVHNDNHCCNIIVLMKQDLGYKILQWKSILKNFPDIYFSLKIVWNNWKSPNLDYANKSKVPVVLRFHGNKAPWHWSNKNKLSTLHPRSSDFLSIYL